jgi:CheY-like chemotaxis protein
VVVDDGPIFRDAIFRVLTADQHDVVLASNGHDAWDLIQKNMFDIIYADPRLPGLDVERLYRLVSDISSDLAKKMVFVTGDTASVSARNIIGATDKPVLGEPFDINEVRQLIDSFS